MPRMAVIKIFAARAGAELERKQAQEAWQKAHDELEQWVKERTAELVETNRRLEQEINERQNGLPVLNPAGELAGIFTVQDLERANDPDKPLQTVGQACTHELLTAYPDEAIGTALRRMGPRDIGRLPVIARDNPHCLVGLLRRTDLVRAYDVALPSTR